MYEELENNCLWIAVLFLLGSFFIGFICGYFINKNKIEIVNNCIEYNNVNYCETKDSDD